MNESLLRHVIEATKEGSYIFTTADEQKELSGYIEINPTIIGFNNTFATRANQDGLNYIFDDTNKNGESIVDSTVLTVPIVPAVETKPTENQYSFDSFDSFNSLTAMGQSFHVSFTTAKKKINSFVKAANKSFLIIDPTGKSETIKRKTKKGEVMSTRPVMIPSRRFLCVSVDEYDPLGPGYRIFRIL